MAAVALRRSPALLLVAALAALALALSHAGRLPDWAWRFPPGREIDLAAGPSRFFKWLTRAGIGPLTVKDVTRGLGAAGRCWCWEVPLFPFPRTVIRRDRRLTAE